MTISAITNYNGIDFTDFLRQINRLYKKASNFQMYGDFVNEARCLNEALVMKEAFFLIFGDVLDIIIRQTDLTSVIIEKK